jgi:ATP-dependent DNA helicase RecQ
LLSLDTIPQTLLETLLLQRFGLKAFRRGQAEIISAILKNKDVLAVLPTGGGKSLCYQLPAVYKQELIIVISPLIALMNDQVASLTKLGIPAGALHSGQTEAEKKDVFYRLAKGGAFVLYLSPERAQKERFHTWIKERKIGLFAIDEAHCVSQWGHDFRPEYGQLGILKKIRPDVPILALTASATPAVLEDIAKQLSLVEPESHIHGFYRPNLYYQVEYCEDDDEKQAFLLQSLEQTPKGRVIVYCGTRKNTEAMAKLIKKHFKKVDFYHAGMSSEDRTRVQESYAAGDIRILVATNAFGMGIDHPDVRLVLHFQLPANIDSLYQEMGRAGRDGEHSTCIMLHSKNDKGLQSFFIRGSKAPRGIINARYRNLDALIAYAEGGECRQAEILHYYRDAQRIKACGHCDACDPASDRKIQKPVVAQSRSIATDVKVAKRRKKKESTNSSLSAEEERRFQSLKAWRKEKATELDVPAFVIFGDKTLRQLAVENPVSLEGLGHVYGFGEVKLERFGNEILQRLRLVL